MALTVAARRSQRARARRERGEDDWVHPACLTLEPALRVERALYDGVGGAARGYRLAHRIAAAVIANVREAVLVAFGTVAISLLTTNIDKCRGSPF